MVVAVLTRRVAGQAPAETGVRLRLLGGFAVAFDGTRLDLPPGQRRLLALLGLRQTSSRAQIAGMLWPEVSDSRALGCLRTALWRLERLLNVPGQLPDQPADQVVVSEGGDIHLGTGVRVDVDELVRMARVLEDGGDPRPAAQLAQIAQGDLLPGWYDDWVLVERESLRQLRLHALEDLARAQLRLHQYGPALRSAIAAERIEPLRETPHRLVMQIHLAEGNSYEALHTYHSYRDLVHRELGVPPSPLMQALFTETLRPAGHG
jgi:DNA-binding SARP family transcriptional activator